MKRRGRHLEKELTAIRVRNIREPGRYADGNGLHLVVDRSGARRWILRTVVHGRRRDMGLGSVQLVSLSEAREKAREYRKIAREGGDPFDVRGKANKSIPTFQEAAEIVYAERSSAWKNEKHITQWINTLRQYVYPSIGNLRVDLISTPNVLKVLSPIWLLKPVTARRVRQRIGTVMDWAKAAGFREGDNPIEGVVKGLPDQPNRENHHAAMPYADVPAFIAQLRQYESDDIAKLAFEFLILTAARTNEVLQATWSEIDEKTKTWTIPVERMKSGREHKVPLSPRCRRILRLSKRYKRDDEFIFPGRSFGKPLSNMVFMMMLKRMVLPFTVHGFRSSFRDWAAEQTNYSREVCEMALAHTIKDKAEAAYRRGDLFEKRRKLMNLWSNFVNTRKARN